MMFLHYFSPLESERMWSGDETRQGQQTISPPIPSSLVIDLRTGRKRRRRRSDQEIISSSPSSSSTSLCPYVFIGGKCKSVTSSYHMHYTHIGGSKGVTKDMVSCRKGTKKAPFPTRHFPHLLSQTKGDKIQEEIEPRSSRA